MGYGAKSPDFFHAKNIPTRNQHGAATVRLDMRQVDPFRSGLAVWKSQRNKRQSQNSATYPEPTPAIADDASRMLQKANPPAKARQT